MGESMKVLYITMMYPVPKYPQKGVFCHEQVKALINNGVDVDVVVPLPFYDSDYEKKYWKYDGVNIRYLKYFKLPRTIGFQYIGKNLYLALINSGINFKNYDILHADAPLPSGDAVRLISRKYHIPYVIHGHGLDVFLDNSYKDTRNCKKILQTCIKVYQQSNAIACVSHKVLECMQKKIDVSSKAYVVYNGVDIEKFVPLKHENKKVEIISIGNLIQLKGHDFTIRAIKQLIEEGNRNIHLRIVGRGNKEKELKQLVNELKLEEYVEFLGYLSYDNVLSLLQNSDIFVLPSYYEALGCVYLEAMSCGVPVIGCINNGIDEIIQNGVDGFLIEGKNVEGIVESIKKMIREKRYKEMGILARQHVEENYSWMNSASRLIMIYKKILNC